VTTTHTPKTSAIRTLYQAFLALAAGFSLGWFAWLIASRVGTTTPPLWPYAAAGVLVGFAVVWRMAKTDRGRKWMAILWIPVVALVALMTAVVMALRAWGS